MTEREAYLYSRLGKPWYAQGEGPDAYSCWGLFVEAQARLWGRHLSHVDVPPEPSWRWMLDAFRAHPDRDHWAEVQCPHGIVTAQDGAGVLMARSSSPAHIGIWLAPEGLVMHVDQVSGVVFDTTSFLRVRGWRALHFYEHVQGG